MYKKTVTYTDFNDEEIKEDLYFNLSKAELTEMQLTSYGGFDNVVQAIINAKDVPELVKLVKQIILTSYGKKSPDGKRFEKSEEISKAFEQSPAYEAVFLELLHDDVAAAEFVNQIMPKEVREEVEKLQKAAK